MSKSPEKKKKNKEYSAWRTVGKLLRDTKPIAWAIAIAGVVCIGSVFLSVIAPEVVSRITNMIYDYGETRVPIDMQRMLEL